MSTPSNPNLSRFQKRMPQTQDRTQEHRCDADPASKGLSGWLRPQGHPCPPEGLPRGLSLTGDSGQWGSPQAGGCVSGSGLWSMLNGPFLASTAQARP